MKARSEGIRTANGKLEAGPPKAHHRPRRAGRPEASARGEPVRRCGRGFAVAIKHFGLYVRATTGDGLLDSAPFSEPHCGIAKTHEVANLAHQERIAR